MSGKKNQDRKSADRQAKAPRAIPQPAPAPNDSPIVPPMLTFVTTGQNNFSTFRRAMEPYAENKFGPIGTLVRTNRHWAPPPVPAVRPEDFDTTNDPIGDKKLLHLEEVKAHAKQTRELRAQWVSLSAELWRFCSPGSQAAITAHADYPAFSASRDPLALWNIIRATHVGSLTGSAAIDGVNALMRYHHLRQSATESTDAFKQRVDAALVALDAAGQRMPNDETQAGLYINALDNARYATLKVDLNNEEVRGLNTRPKTLLEAHAMALRTTVVGTKASGGSTEDNATVFVASASVPRAGKSGKSGKGGGKGGASKSPGGGGGAGAPNTAASGASNGAPQNPGAQKNKGCILCDSPSHWMGKCPYLPAAKQFVSRQPRDTASDVAALAVSSHVPFENGHEVIFCGECEVASETQPSNAADHVAIAADHPSAATQQQQLQQQGELSLALDSHRLNATEFAIDNGATVSLVRNADLLVNLRRAQEPIIVRGVGGSITVDMVGDFPPLGCTVYYSKHSPANLLSFSCLAVSNKAHYDRSSQSFVVYDVHGKKISFSRRASERAGTSTRGHLYTHVFAAVHTKKQRSDPPQSGTVEEREARYSKNEVADARAVRDLMRRMGYPSAADLAQLLSHGKVLNTRLTSHDLRRAQDIYGPDVASLKGKTTSSPSTVVKVEYIPRPVEQVLTLHADIMFVQGEPFLLVKAMPLGLALQKSLPSRTAPALFAAVASMCGELKGRGFDPRTILSDGEGGVAKIKDQLTSLGLILNPAGPGQHVPVIENLIRRIKERTRAVLSGLPYRLPLPLLRWLVAFCVIRLNMCPSGTRVDQSSPRELFTGRKIDASIDLRTGFGDYCQCHAENIIKNSMTPRTQGAISLLPVGNLQGSVKFYCLETNSVITRDHWTPLPTPSVVIDFMNDLAGPTKKGSAGLDPVFTRGLVTIDHAPEQGEPALIPFVEPPRVVVDPKAHQQETLPDFVPPQPEVSVVQPAVEPVQQQTAAEPTDVDPHAEPPPSMMPEATIDPALITGVQPQSQEAPEATQRQHASPPPPAPQPTTEERRYPARANRTSWRERSQQIMLATLREKTLEYGLHLTVKKAIKTFGPLADEAILKELTQMLNLKVWTPVEVDRLSSLSSQAIIFSSMFLKEKFDAQGIFTQLKARLVACGNQQDKSLYPSVSCPTVSQTSVFLGAGIAAMEGRIAVTLDIVGAFLKIDMTGHPVHVRLSAYVARLLCQLRPEYRQFLLKDGTLVVRLRKAMYGCVESGRLLYQHIRGTLIGMGFTQNPYDPCVFNKGPLATQCSIFVYVDDLMITCTNAAIIDHVVKQLTGVYDTVKVHRGDKHSYLGMLLDFSDPGECNISMDGYIDEVLRTYGVSGTVSTPATPTLFDVREDVPRLAEPKREVFHTSVAKLLYLAKRVRPELLPGVSFLASRVTCANEDDWQKLDRLYKYLNGSKDLGLTLRFDPKMELQAYVDASYGVHADRKSQTGAVLTLGGGCFGAMSAKQKIVVKSSTEAELVGVSDFVSEVINRRMFLMAQGYKMGPAIMWQDNQSTMAMIKNGGPTSARTRHVSIRYFFVADRVASGEIAMRYKATAEMIADILTKALQGELFRVLRGELLGKACRKE